MIALPNFDHAFDHENAFYLSCDVTRLGKFMAHSDLFRMITDVPGAIVECGVFKGASLARFAAFRALLGHASTRQIVAFDSFGDFPATSYVPDQAPLERFVAAAGNQSISTQQMLDVLRHKKCDTAVELIAGDICETVPAYVRQHPELRIALLNLDTDVYEPAVTILEHLYPRLIVGGVLIIDDYGVFPGETQAVDEYFAGRRVKIRKFPYCTTPCFVVKEA